jgi:hypothetical protein
MNHSDRPFEVQHSHTRVDEAFQVVPRELEWPLAWRRPPDTATSKKAGEKEKE